MDSGRSDAPNGDQVTAKLHERGDQILVAFFGGRFRSENGIKKGFASPKGAKTLTQIFHSLVRESNFLAKESKNLVSIFHSRVKNSRSQVSNSALMASDFRSHAIVSPSPVIFSASVASWTLR
jgi:hypothetical protein